MGCLPASEREELTDGNGLSVMTWNLEWFYDEMTGDNYSPLAREKSAPDRRSWEWHRDAVAASIARVRPTIVAVQEVENRRVLWYLARALERNHQLQYREFLIEGRDHFTEQNVGFLVRQPAEVVSVQRFSLPERLRETGEFGDVSKHLCAVIEVTFDGHQERLTVMNVHLRAGSDASSDRVRQARSIHHWVRDLVAAGEHVIVLGDLNTDQTDESAPPETELFVLTGKETTTEVDDLIDLHTQLPVDGRRTHLLPRKQFDRILVSRSLVDDDPNRLDLTLKSVVVRPDLAIQGKLDRPGDHWDRYWDLADDERDLSDHFPVIATFSLR